MKCPKCGYHSFDHLEDCKKCGQSLADHKSRYGFRSLFGGTKSVPPPSTPLSDSPPEEGIDPPTEVPTADGAVSFGFDFMAEEPAPEPPGESALDDLLTSPEEGPPSLPEEGLKLQPESEESGPDSIFSEDVSEPETPFPGDVPEKEEAEEEVPFLQELSFEATEPPGEEVPAEEPTMEIEEDWVFETDEEPLLSTEAKETVTADQETTEATWEDQLTPGTLAGNQADNALDLPEEGDHESSGEEEPALPEFEGEDAFSFEAEDFPAEKGDAGFEPEGAEEDDAPTTGAETPQAGSAPEEIAAEEADFWTEDLLSVEADPDEEEVDLTELLAEAGEEPGAESPSAEDLPFLHLTLPSEKPVSADAPATPSPKPPEPETAPTEPAPVSTDAVEKEEVPAEPIAESTALAVEGEENLATAPSSRATSAAIAARVGGCLFDLAILAGTYLLFLVAGEWALDPTASGMGLIPSAGTLLTLSAPYFLVLFSLVFGYFTLFHFLSGQTPGKMLFRVRVESLEGDSLTLSQAFLRSVGGLFSLLPAGLGFLVIGLSRQRRGWNDRLAGSRVVRV